MKYIAFMLFSLLLFSCSENGKFIEIKNEASKLVKVDAIFIDFNQNGEIDNEERFSYEDTHFYVNIIHHDYGDTILYVLDKDQKIMFSSSIINSKFYKFEVTNSKRLGYSVIDSVGEVSFIIKEQASTRKNVILIYDISIITKINI